MDVYVPYTFGGYCYGKNKWHDWCKEHCKGRFEITARTTRQIFGVFELEEDATLFLLKWS